MTHDYDQSLNTGYMPTPRVSSYFLPCAPDSSTRYQHSSPIEHSPSPSEFSHPNFTLADNSTDSPQSSYRFPDLNAAAVPIESTHLSTLRSSSTHQSVAHPYARLYAKKDSTKRHRKIWNHALEKSLFNSHELSTMGAPHRRTIYIASLEAHVDRLHAQLLSLGLYPIPFDKLEPYRGLNSKTAKSMVAGLQNDTSHTRLKMLELERSTRALRDTLGASHATQIRRHSVDSSASYRYSGH